MFALPHPRPRPFFARWRRPFALAALLLAVAASATGASAQTTPTVSFYSLLRGVSVNTSTNELTLDQMWIGFLPDSPGEVTVTVSRSGEALVTYPTMLVTEDGVFDSYLIDVAGNEVVLEDRDYAIEFALDGRPFRRFSFQARVVEGADRYNPTRFAFLDGPWQEYAALLARAPDRIVDWREIHRNEDLSVRQRDGVRRIEVFRDGDLFATSEDAVNAKIGVQVTGYPTWYLSEKRLYRVTGDGTTPLYGRDLTACGTCAYEVRVEHLGAYLYEDPAMNDGPVKTPTVTETDRYRFRVENGQIVLDGDQDPATTDPLDLVEGAGGAFWLRNEASSL